MRGRTTGGFIFATASSHLHCKRLPFCSWRVFPQKIFIRNKINLKTLQRKFAAWAEPGSSVGPHGWRQKTNPVFQSDKKKQVTFSTFLIEKNQAKIQTTIFFVLRFVGPPPFENDSHSPHIIIITGTLGIKPQWISNCLNQSSFAFHPDLCSCLSSRTMFLPMIVWSALCPCIRNACRAKHWL